MASLSLEHSRASTPHQLEDNCFEVECSVTVPKGGAILIPGFCSPKALKPLLPVLLSELEDLADEFAAIERVAMDARPCMANQVHHLRLAVDGGDVSARSWFAERK